MTTVEVLRKAAYRICEKGFGAELGTPEGPCCFIGTVRDVMGYSLLGQNMPQKIHRVLWPVLYSANLSYAQESLGPALESGLLTPEIAADLLTDLAAALEVDPLL